MTPAASGSAVRLGGGGAPDIPIGRIVLALLACIAMAWLIASLIRRQGGRGVMTGLAPYLRRPRSAVEVVETRRLSMHADVSLVRHDGREYLLLVQAGANSVLREREVAPRAEPAP